MKIKISAWMLKFISKVCSKNKGLRISKYSKLSGEVIYKLEHCDTARE